VILARGQSHWHDSSRDNYFVAVRQFSQPQVEVTIPPGAFRVESEVSRMDKQVTRRHGEFPVKFMGVTD
jgi:cupin superfamily acireductone dioxygenase involved in methionine salvage